MLRSWKEHPATWLTIALAIALVVPMLMMDGMFMDAIMYTSVGNNLAQGYGSPWFLYYSTSHTESVPGFFENPPLGYWLFAIFFKIFGDHMLVERFYVLIVYLITIWLLMKLWKKVQPEVAAINWLPVLLWVIVPLTFWAYRQNLMENTMTVFIIPAIIFGWKAAKDQHHSVRNSIIAGVFIFLAFMVKGFPGLYPLVTIAVYWLVYRDISFLKALKLSLWMLLFAAGPILLLFLLPVSGDSLGYYLFHRTLGRINQLPTVDNRFRILWDLTQQLILPLILVFTAWLVTGRPRFDKKALWFLLIIGLCGVIPLCLTKVQRGFYLIPAIPVICMALAVVAGPAVLRWQSNSQNKGRKILATASVLILIGAIVSSFFKVGKPKRDQKMLEDVHHIGSVVGKHDTIAAPIELAHSWSTKAYLMRYYYIQLNHHLYEPDNPQAEYVLVKKDAEPPSAAYRKVGGEMNELVLYKKTE